MILMVQDLKKALTEELGKGKEHRILTDPEDHFVYSIEKYFDSYREDEQGRAEIPDVVVKVDSMDEADRVRQIILEMGYIPSFRDKFLNPQPKEGKGLVLIDSTEPFHLPLMAESPTRLKELSDLRLERRKSAETILQDKCEDHTICKGYCPIGQTVYDDIETWSVKGRQIVSRELVKDAGEIEHSKKVSDILFSCASCGNCFRACTEEMDRMFEGPIEGKRAVIEEREGVVPPNIQDALEKTFINRNPWGYPRSERGDWTENLDIDVPILKEGDSAEILYFVGCSPSYENRNQEIAKSLAKIFDYLDLDFGILGNNESCCGNSQRVMGEDGLFEEMVERNSEVFSSIDFDRVVTSSPHCFNDLKNKYPDFGVEVEPYHYTQLLVDKLKAEDLSGSGEERAVAYHDSCYLSRHNDVRNEPRELLNRIPGVKFVEINTDTLCCGGGGGRMWFEDPITISRPPKPIVERALNKGADTLAVACPFCLTNFEDEVKSMNLEDELEVKDISELLCSAL